MDMITRYVDAVKQFLPKGQQQDISRELSENIRAEMDDREAALGRPLTEAEQAQVIRNLGHPVLMASRFQSAPNGQPSGQPNSLTFGQQLIGPALFPLYLRILFIAISLISLGNLVAAYFAGTPGSELGSIMLGNALVQFVIITALFSAYQRHIYRHPDVWDPYDPLSPVAAKPDPQRVPRAESLTAIVVSLVMLVWLLSLRGAGLPAETGLTLTAVWAPVYWVLVGLTAIMLAPSVINLFRPRWVTFRTVSRLVVDAVWLGLMVFLLLSGPWVADGPPGLAERLNDLIRVGLQWTVLFSVVILVWDAKPLWWRKKKRD